MLSEGRISKLTVTLLSIPQVFVFLCVCNPYAGMNPLTPAKATIVAFEVMIDRNSRPDCAGEALPTLHCTCYRIDA